MYNHYIPKNASDAKRKEWIKIRRDPDTEPDISHGKALDEEHDKLQEKIDECGEKIGALGDKLLNCCTDKCCKCCGNDDSDDEGEDESVAVEKDDV